MILAVPNRRILVAGLLAATLGSALTQCRERPAPSAALAPGAPPTPLPRSAGATFVGREACKGCHLAEYDLWQGSHHDLAMQEVTEDTVLGDFGGRRFTHFGVTSTFFKRGGKHFVRTDGPDGKLHEYPIAYTFGVYPLQQYLIAFPGGRYQALNVVWDARPKKEGGQRWFHLYPKEAVPSTDPLHWTGPYQNWNFMCAECHSTNVQKGFVAAEKRYDTTFSEIDVSCEACHGPASAHVDWARAVEAGKAGRGDADKGLAVVLEDPAGKAAWIINPETGLAKRSVPRTSQAEIEACARCHARRSVVAADYAPGQPLLQTHRPALLTEGLYYADGQVQDEVFEYQSFLQSKMHASGVSCSDCHNPHSLKVSGSADRVCAGCHAAEKFETPAHHFHEAGSAGASCMSCHMPTRDFMVVHSRHDHSFRVPRPDLSDAIGAPNACTQCHRDRSDRWAADAAKAWWGDPARREPPYGETIHAGREGDVGAGTALAALAADSTRPAIRRATAASLLGRNESSGGRDALVRALADPDPLVRFGAIHAVRDLPPSERLPLAAPLLRDPILTIRIDAARALAAVPKEQLRAGERAAFDSALAEYERSLSVDADRAEAHLSLAELATDLGDSARAEREYRIAIDLVPAFAASYANLADLHRTQGRDPEGEAILRRGLSAAPGDAGLHHALGLALVRQKRLPEALVELERAARIPPERARYVYVWAVALDSVGQTRRALEVLAAAEKRHGGNREILEALVSLNARAGNPDASARYASKLAALESAPGP
jgi:Tfp pilus assembly protein PilF